MPLDDLKAKREALVQPGPSSRTGKLVAFYTRIMPRVVDAERCEVFVRDPERDEVWLKAGTGVPEQENPVPGEGSVVGDVIATGEPVIVSDPGTKPADRDGAGESNEVEARNVLCVPIKSSIRNEVIGAFQFQNKLNGREFTDEDENGGEKMVHVSGRFAAAAELNSATL